MNYICLIYLYLKKVFFIFILINAYNNIKKEKKMDLTKLNKILRNTLNILSVAIIMFVLIATVMTDKMENIRGFKLNFFEKSHQMLINNSITINIIFIIGVFFIFSKIMEFFNGDEDTTWKEIGLFVYESIKPTIIIAILRLWILAENTDYLKSSSSLLIIAPMIMSIIIAIFFVIIIAINFIKLINFLIMKIINLFLINKIYIENNIVQTSLCLFFNMFQLFAIMYFFIAFALRCGC